MERIWAPWRIGYVGASRKVKLNKRNKCLFCELLKKHQDKKNLIVKRTNFSFSILNKFPYNNGHIMVAPLRHIAKIEDLKKEEVSDLFNLILKTKVSLAKVLRPQGYNIGINLGKVSGAGIERHLHIHIVPRWLGDANFMPTTASIKVISQSLDALYEKLKDYGS